MFMYESEYAKRITDLLYNEYSKKVSKAPWWPNEISPTDPITPSVAEAITQYFQQPDMKPFKMNEFIEQIQLTLGEFSSADYTIRNVVEDGLRRWTCVIHDEEASTTIYETLNQLLDRVHHTITFKAWIQSKSSIVSVELKELIS